MPTQINRDPFARQTTVREQTTPTACDWCGQYRTNKTRPNRPQPLYRYGTQRDDRTAPDWHRGAFCSKSCHDSYHA